MHHIFSDIPIFPFRNHWSIKKKRKLLINARRPLYSNPKGPSREKTCFWGFANNTGADQPMHPSCLINAFVISFVESIICKLATGEISIFQLRRLAFSETSKTFFSLDEAQIYKGTVDSMKSPIRHCLINTFTAKRDCSRIYRSLPNATTVEI